MASDKGGFRLYVVNQGSHDLSAYFINRSNGFLTQVPGSPFPLVGTGDHVTVHPSGKFVYATSTTLKGGQEGINAFKVNANGSLSVIAGSPFNPPVGSTAIVIDPSGKYLYVSGGNNDIGAYTINQISGALTPVPGSPFPVIGPPSCSNCANSPADLSIDNTGNFLYGGEPGSGFIAGFRIERSTGALKNLPGSPYLDRASSGPGDAGATPWSVSVDPTDKFVYVYDQTDNDLATYGLNRSTGVLTLLGKTPNTYGGVCDGDIVRVDPSGSFVYGLGLSQTGCVGKNAVLGFSINQSSGNLTTVPGSPVIANTTAFFDGIAVTP